MSLWNKVIFFVSLCSGLSGCGVKGDPLPPHRPPEIGTGKPSFKRATEGLELPETLEEDDLDKEENEEGEEG